MPVNQGPSCRRAGGGGGAYRPDADTFVLLLHAQVLGDPLLLRALRDVPEPSILGLSTYMGPSSAPGTGAGRLTHQSLPLLPAEGSEHLVASGLLVNALILRRHSAPASEWGWRLRDA